jgi:hypothetical protein
MVGDSRRWFCIRGLTIYRQCFHSSYRERRVSYPLVSSSTCHCELDAEAEVMLAVFEVEIVIS